MTKLFCYPIALLVIGLFVTSVSAQTEKPQTPNPLVTTLQFAHLYAKPDLLGPGKDRQLKSTLITALRENVSGLAWNEVSGVFDQAGFQKLTGTTGKLTLENMERTVRDKTGFRNDLFPPIRRHADLLTTQFDMIEERHRESADQLAAWLVKNYKQDQPLNIIIICTGNSRRSMIGAAMGNVAAAYYGLPKVRFFSGGTAPSAFNKRAVASLKEIGFEVEVTGKEATRGKGGEANPEYRVRWGKALEGVEFSKLYSDAHNPQKDFAAILVCSEADESCPTVKGAKARFTVPYFDPKAFDDAPFEAAKYAERRDDIGRFVLNVLLQARRSVAID